MSDVAGRTTLADVAKRAGVSKTAASLVLNERPGTRLTADTARRVRDAATELGYRPNPSARSLRMGATRTVGVISDNVIVTRYASAMIRGALDSAHAHHHTMLIAESGGDAERMRDAVEAMLDRRADGLIFAAMGAKLVDLPPVPDQVRVVMVNGSGSRGEPAVLPGEYDAGYRIAQELLDAGHREIAIVGYAAPERIRFLTSVTIGTRLNGIRAAFRKASVRPAMLLEDLRWEPAVGYELTRRALTGRKRITALLCMNDRLAFGAYQALQQQGLSVPTDISIGSFDDDEIASYLIPGLTTAGIPYEEMGRLAMDMLLDAPAPPDHTVLVEMPIRRRGSIAALAAAQPNLQPASAPRSKGKATKQLPPEPRLI